MSVPHHVAQWYVKWKPACGRGRVGHGMSIKWWKFKNMIYSFNIFDAGFPPHWSDAGCDGSFTMIVGGD